MTKNARAALLLSVGVIAAYLMLSSLSLSQADTASAPDCDPAFLRELHALSAEGKGGVSVQLQLLRCGE